MRSRTWKAVALVAALLALSGPAYAAGPAMTMRFEQQQQTATPVDNPVLLLQESFTIGGGSFFESDALDMRAYNSYHLAIEVVGVDWLEFDMAKLNIAFFDQLGGPPIPEVFSEQWFMFNTGANAPNQIADAVHGGWMDIRVDDYNGSGRTANVVLYVYGSWRSVPTLWVRAHPNFESTAYEGSNVLYETETAFPGAGGTDIRHAKLGLGRAIARLEGDTAGATMTIEYGSTMSPLRDTLTLTAAGVVEKEILLPTRQARVTITNGSGANVVRASIIQERYPQ